MKILVVDNYDSFTWNLVNILRKSKQHSFDVWLSDKIDLANVQNFDKIIFSPGPDVPKQGDIMWQILEHYKNKKSILGICLGFQAIALYFRGSLTNLKNVVHGQSREITFSKPVDPLFSGISAGATVGLYHSWTVSKNNFPESLKITALSVDGLIMATAHKTFDIRGVQFHPESIMTPFGEKMIGNWLSGTPEI